MPIQPFYFAPDDPEQSIPLPTRDEEQEMQQSDIPVELPILTLRNTVLFPGVVLPITVGRDASLKLVKDAFSSDKLIGVVAQRVGAGAEGPGCTRRVRADFLASDASDSGARGYSSRKPTPMRTIAVPNKAPSAR